MTISLQRSLKNITSYLEHNSGPWPQPNSSLGANMRTACRVVNILGSLLMFLGLEGTACHVMVALVAPDFIIQRRPAAAVEEVLLCLLNPDLFNLALVLLTGI